MRFAVEVSSRPSHTARAQQLRAAFDVPAREVETLRWEGELPLEERPWNVGLIVGPSGSGKSTVLADVFGPPVAYEWTGDAVVDDFPRELPLDELTRVCGAVGFNTIPAWLRRYEVLSTGEQFRVTLARLLADAPDIAVIDEFTSVVDRQVAKIGAHAVAKFMRRNDRRLVAATCHYDVIDWMQPDWIFEPATATFGWRSLQPRPGVECVIQRQPYTSWARFAPYHYLTATLNRAARCFVLTANGTPAAFCGVIHRPARHNPKLKAVSRLVTLPDWQGLGLAFVLVDHIAAAYTALGFDLHTYPAHPALIRSFDRSPVWQMRAKPADYRARVHRPNSSIQVKNSWQQGRRPNAVFRYVGDPMDVDQAVAVTGQDVREAAPSASMGGR